jgi:UDP-GlcNAc:undecaprenyl-phosphate/decaprenyl-phosphate GlcNAc-1-phosphate transferase
MADVTTLPWYQVLPPYMPVFYVSFVATLVLTPLMRILAHRHGIVDDPDGKRKVHVQPIAYLGGVSIFLGWLAGVSISVFLRPHNPDIANVQVPPGVLMGAAVVVLFGLMDDVYSLSPKTKIFGQFLAALLLVVPGALNIGQDFFLGKTKDINQDVHAGGISWMILAPLQSRSYINIHQWSEPAQNALLWGTIIFSGLCAVLIIISACNACNLLDGLDGLCSGVTGVMSVGYLALSVILASQAMVMHGNQELDPVRITLSLALLGAVMGFLPFNFNPASIFMGDTGSMFLGYMCGTMMLLFGQDGIPKWFLSAVVIFGLPMLDTLLAIVRRKLNGQPIFSPDSNHFHHFLIKRGYTVKKAVLLSYGLATLFVSFALVIVVIPTRMALGIYMVLFGWIVVAAFKMGMIFQNRGPVATNTLINPLVIKSDADLRQEAELTSKPEFTTSMTSGEGNGQKGLTTPANGSPITSADADEDEKTLSAK